MINLKKILSRNVRGKLMYALSWLPDEPYVKLFYYATTGRKLNLKNPVTFEDKQQWLKLHDHNDRYTQLVDKYAVREHIKNTIGAEYSFPLLGHWDRFDEIDFDALPEQFVLKCNHDSGSVKVIKSKSALSAEEMQQLKKHFDKKIRRNFYFAGREFPYKNIKPCIIAEQYMTDDKQETSSLNDYKFLCFYGEPKIVLIVTDRATDCRYDFYDMDFKQLDLRYGKGRDDDKNQKPEFFEEMKEIAAKLSEGIPFVRIDLYEVNGQVFFGEYTFYDGGGFQWYKPDEWEYKLGSWLKI
ncbi:MAG: glycosyl transferase [Clostridia bacterium]|nr:glycosyl transferase [Clostridia bacterium]